MNPQWIMKRNAAGLRARATRSEIALLEAFELIGSEEWCFQAVVGQFIVDFLSVQEARSGIRIGIELDGKSHNGKRENDLFRDFELYDFHKVLILRFPDEMVVSNPIMFASHINLVNSDFIR